MEDIRPECGNSLRRAFGQAEQCESAADLGLKVHRILVPASFPGDDVFSARHAFWFGGSDRLLNVVGEIEIETPDQNGASRDFASGAVLPIHWEFGVSDRGFRIALCYVRLKGLKPLGEAVVACIHRYSGEQQREESHSARSASTRT